MLLDEVRFVAHGFGHAGFGNTYRILESIYTMLKSAVWHKKMASTSEKIILSERDFHPLCFSALLVRTLIK
jgi:hypothetical protein